MRRLTVLIALIVLLAGLVPLSPSLAGPSHDAPIRLKTAIFWPERGERPDIPAGLTAAMPRSGETGYYLVQFAGPIQTAWKDALAGLGVEIVEYVPDFAFKVRMTRAVASRVRRLDSVVWLDVFHPAYKLSPNLTRDGIGLYTVRVERGADAGLAATAIARSGVQVLAREKNVVLVATDSAQVDAIARVRDVAWIQDFVLQEKHNEYSAGVVMGANTANANGYDGSTQIAAVADTGLGDGTASGAHPDIPSSRITAIYDWTSGGVGGCYQVLGDGPQDVDSGHGTHVSVSVLGDGGPSGEAKGTAPAANLVFQAVEDYVNWYGFCEGLYPDGYYLMGLPDDIHDLFQQAYGAGARVHSNSWGHDAAGDYDIDSVNADDFIWNNPDMTITFSAGNEGTDANANGVVDSDSTGSPATAKNVITVGASENDRQGNYPCDTNLTYTSHDAYQTGQTCASMGGNQVNFLGTWGQRYPSDFPAEPLYSDVTAGNQEQMASWSSRGPADDGRIKPDVVAPGTWILSGYSGLYQEGYGDPTNPQNGLYQWDGWGMPKAEPYKYMGGTSMANPLTAGAATVVRDYYQKAHSHNASAALVKATLINSAVDMLDENNDGADDNDYPIPNDHEGWGRVNVGNATDGSHLFVDESTGLNTSGSATYQYNVASSGTPFKITLVWSDYPSTETASQNLVNDLDLIVTAPDDTVYRGNNFGSGWSQSGGSLDRVNNVENVYVQSPQTGVWTVEVNAYNVPQGPQPFALVVDGSFGNTPPVASFTYDCTGLACDFDGSGSYDPDGYIVSYDWDFGDGSPHGSGVTTSHTYAQANTYTVVLTVTDDDSATDDDTQNVTVSEEPTTMHVGDLDGSSSTSGKKKWRATVTITVHDANHNLVADATVSGAWSGGASGSDSCTTGANGQCSITSPRISNAQNSVTFTVNNVTHATLTYQSSANHDPDGDSDGTAITILKP